MSSTIRAILVPVDGSPGAARARDLAEELARGCGASLTALYVLPPDALVTIGAQALTGEQLQEAQDRMARRAFEGAGIVGERAAGVATATAIGHPAPALRSPPAMAVPPKAPWRAPGVGSGPGPEPWYR